MKENGIQEISTGEFNGITGIRSQYVDQFFNSRI